MFDLLFRIIEIIFPVLLIVLMGYGYARHNTPNLEWLNRLTLDVLGPLLVLTHLAASDFHLQDHLSLLLAALLIVLGSGLLAWLLARQLGFQIATFVPPNMFGNTGNMGLPLALFAFGPGSLGPAVAMFAMTNLLHFTLGIKLVKRTAHLGKLLFSPMNLATVLGCILSWQAWHMPQALLAPLKMMGDSAIPLMLFALGARMIHLPGHALRAGVVGGLSCPVFGLLVGSMIAPWLSLNSQQLALLFLYASLPPAVLNFLVAERFNQEPEKVASIVLVGNILALVFVPIGLFLGLRV